MKHIKRHHRPARASFDWVIWSHTDTAGGWGVSIEFVDGVLGRRMWGGFAGGNEFTPFFKG